MKGAGKYYYPIQSCYKSLGLEKVKDGYYGKHLLFKLGEHARGKELFIYIIPNEEDLKEKGLNKCENVRIYGVVSGSPGWTESYGFILHGKWESACQEILDKSVELYEERKRINEENRKIKEKEERESIINKAKSFESLF